MRAGRRDVKPGALFPLLALAVPNVPSAFAFGAMSAESPGVALWGGVAVGVTLGAAWLVLASPWLPRPTPVSGRVLRLAATGLLMLSAFAFPAWVRFGAHDYLRELRGRTPVLELSEAGDSDEGMMVVRGGTVRTELAGRHVYRSNRNTLTAIVAPLVPLAWTAQSPVEAWVACIERYDAEAACAERFAVPRRVGSVEEWEDPYSVAGQDAERRHGLRSTARPLVLEILDDPVVDPWAELGAFAVLLGLYNVLMLGVTGRCLARALRDAGHAIP